MSSVLIIDDADYMRSTIRLILEKNGYEVAGEARDGVEGLKKYMELRPDLVTMDLVMPDVNGIESLKMIRAFDPHARVLVVSAVWQQHMLMQAIREGARGFVIKPFKEEYLLEAMARVNAERRISAV